MQTVMCVCAYLLFCFHVFFALALALVSAKVLKRLKNLMLSHITKPNRTKPMEICLYIRMCMLYAVRANVFVFVRVNQIF